MWGGNIGITQKSGTVVRRKEGNWVAKKQTRVHPYSGRGQTGENFFANVLGKKK